VPLISLILLLVFGTWFLWHRFSLWRKNVLFEAHDAENKLAKEFEALQTSVHTHLAQIRELRKTRLTKSEETLYSDLEADLKRAQTSLKKEIVDIENVVQ
jgi:ABC-type nickel/cobalt efflux system permease component RcnA